jgi:hypothetical protein
MLRFRIFALLLSLPAGSAPAAILAPQAIAPPTIPVSRAASHLNRVATVCGAITGKHTIAGVGTLIDLGSSSPEPAFRVILWDSETSRVGKLPSAGNICVTGVIGEAQGIPQIVLSEAKNWSLSAPTYACDCEHGCGPPRDDSSNARGGPEQDSGP